MSILSNESMKALQDDYMKGFHAKWEVLTQAYKSHDWLTVERELHKFAGSGTTYKMPEISKLAKAIEMYLEKNNPPDLELVWESMELFRMVLDGRQNDKPVAIENHEVLKKLAR